MIRENARKKVCGEVFEKIDESEKDLSEGFVYILFQISFKKTFKNLKDRFMKVCKEYKPSGSAGGILI